MSARDDALSCVPPSARTREVEGKPRASLARFASTELAVPAAWAPLLPAGVEVGDAARAWRIGSALFALFDDFHALTDRFVPLPPEEDEAEALIRALRDDEDPSDQALAISAALELSVVLTEAELFAATEAAPVLERWRAPHRDGDSLVFMAATRPVPTGNELLELEVDLAHGWVDAVSLGEGWRTMPAFGIHSAPPPPRNPRPPEPRRRQGWLARLLGR